MKKTESLTAKVEQSICKLIREGYYQPGEKLPNEMALSSDLKISRATLREALKALNTQNVIEVRRGIGTFISQTPGMVKDPLGLSFVNLEPHMLDVLHMEYQMGALLIDALKDESQSACDDLIQQMQSTPLREVFSWLHEILKQMAQQMNREYILRLLMAQDEAINQIQAVHPLQSETKEQYTYYINLWVTQLSQNDFEAAKDTFKILLELIEG